MECVFTGYQSQVPAVVEAAVNCAHVIYVSYSAFGAGRDRTRIVTHKVQLNAHTGLVGVFRSFNKIIGTRAHLALRGFVNTHIANFITDGEDEWNKSIPCYGKIEKNARTGVMTVCIPTTEFPNIMKQLNFNNSELVIKNMKANNMLSCESGKTYRKRMITRAGGTVRVYVIKFP